MRLWNWLSLLAFALKETVVGTARLTASALLPDPGISPAIVALESRCTTDVEVSLLSALITIPPGTLVVGIAAATDEHPVILYVHSVYGHTREQVIDEMRELETRMLRATRGTRRSQEVSR